jgi:hypothetical protein
MNALENYLRQVRDLLESSRHVLTEAQFDEVEHLIKHNELGEAIRALAWIIVEENKRVSADMVNNIRVLSEGLIDPDDMPPNLESQINK